MKITFLGGADEVGASSILIEIGGKRLLVDAGIRPSPKARWGLAGDQLPDLSPLDALGAVEAVLVTHAHTDHTGALELVAGRFPNAPFYATPPTIALTRVLHQDARRIMQSRLDEEGELPLYDDVAVQRLLSAFVPTPFYTRVALGESLAATFFPAGHIAGAAMIGLESDEGNLLISGDFSISPQRTVDGARPPAFRPDLLIIESTYGGRLHANRAVQERKLVETVTQVTAGEGKVLIPAFALGRAQEILLILGEFQRRGELPAVPVWADGMVRAICQAYAAFPEALPLALQERIRPDPFFNQHIRPVQTNEQRNALIWQPGPAVIVASSGMLAGGPSLSYARALASSPQHAILLTGYQDEESPGRRLQEVAERGSGSIRLGQDKIDVQCRLGTYAISAHADEGQIISLVETLGPEHVALVHGDEAAQASLEKALVERGRIVHRPHAGQSLQFGFADRKVLGMQAAERDLRTRQAEVNRQRRERMQSFSAVAGKWLLIKGDPPTPARCLALESDRLWVEVAPGLEQGVYPEEVLVLLGEAQPRAEDLAVYMAAQPARAEMEPNQALAYANQHFPPEARLRKTGYRLDQNLLVLTFDFPDAARERFADQLASLEATTGWKVEVISETNQAALNALVRDLLPEGWQIVKGPSIFRDQKRLSVTLQAPSPVKEPGIEAEMHSRFHEISGYTLDLIWAAVPAPGTSAPTLAMPGERMEINAAYRYIKDVLQGSTIYRTSQKGDEIVLSFISPQVGERYQEQIDDLEKQVGWRLSINPQPNQGAILEAARALVSRAGWTVVKGPGIYPDKAEVFICLSSPPEPAVLSELAESFESQTGFRLAIQTPASSAPSTAAGARAAQAASVEIPVKRIRLRPYHQNLSLDPEKLNKAIERARRMGVTPPVAVRRLPDGYLLMDGLYRLRAAEALGLERIPALVE